MEKHEWQARLCPATDSYGPASATVVIVTEDGLCSHVARLDDQWICDEHGGSSHEFARLIAAAPELLEALQAILEGDTMHGVEGFTHADVIQKHYQIARAAISKATA